MKPFSQASEPDPERSGSVRVPELGLAVADVLAGAWRIASLSPANGCVRVVAADGAGRSVAFRVSPGLRDRHASPVEAGGAHVYYESTTLPFAAFADAARALAERLRSHATGGDAAALLRAWLQAIPSSREPGRDGSRGVTIRLGGDVPIGAARAQVREVETRDGRRVSVRAEAGAELDELCDVFAELQSKGVREPELAAVPSVLAARGALARLSDVAGSVRVELLVAPGEGRAAREVLDASSATRLRIEAVFRLRSPSREDVDALARVARELRSSAGASLVIDVPMPQQAEPSLGALARVVEEALGPATEVRRRIRSAAGAPLCLFPDELQTALLERERRADAEPGRAYAEGCATCAVRAGCAGVSEEYARRHGTAELKPLSAEGAAPGAGAKGPLAEALGWETRARLLLLDRPGVSVTLGELVAKESLPQWACILPWTRLELDEGGKYGPCCTQYQEQAAIADADVRELWHGDYMRSFRRAMTRGGRIETCRESCPILAGGTQRAWDFRFHGGPAPSVENQILLAKEMLAGRADVTAAPVAVVFQTTTYCNYNCLMCDYGERGTLADEKPEAFYRALEPWLDKLACIDVNGGEPLASPVFRAFLDGLDFREHAQLRLNLVTNGSYLTPKQLERWSRVRFGSLIISLNAATPATYLAVNRGLAWDRLRENLDALLARRRAGLLDAVVTYSMVVLKQNRHEIRAFAELALRDEVNVRFMLPFGDKNGTSMMNDRVAMEETLATLRDVADDVEARGVGWLARDLRGNVRVLEERLAQSLVQVL